MKMMNNVNLMRFMNYPKELWKDICKEKNARFVKADIPFPIYSEDEFLEYLPQETVVA